VNVRKRNAKLVPSGLRVWIGLGAILAGPFFLANIALQGDEAPPAQKAAEAPASGSAQLVFRGVEEPTVDDRFTLEVFIVNTGKVPLQNLEFTAQLDANLEQPSKLRAFQAAVDTVLPDDLHIVRMTLTPRKSGPGGMEITLRGKNIPTQQVRHVLPISPTYSDLRPRNPEKPLQVKITSFKECIVDREGIVLVNVKNTDSKPTAKLELVVSYATMGHNSHIGGNPAAPNTSAKSSRIPMPASTNPTRQLHVSVPALEPSESHTVPVRLTPRRTGELGIAVTAKNGAAALATTRLHVRFDPNASIHGLLPVRAGAVVPSRLPQTLAEIPEVSLEDPHAKAMAADEAFEHVSHLIEKINHVNKSKTDAYMEALTQHRSDMRGMPFTLGDACRLAADRAQHFQTELSRLRLAMSNPAAMASSLPNPSAEPNNEAAIKARVAALIQVVEPESPQAVRQMVKYLASISHVDATRALAKFAICAEDEQVRKDALAALALRRDKDFSDILERGLDYPWPAVAQRTTEAIAQLKLHDLTPQLVAMLERHDPRAPQVKEQDGKQVTVVREMVRINHLRNCLLCHSPAKQPAVGPNGEVEASRRLGAIAANGPLVAPVPLPNQPIPTPTVHGGYGHFTIPDTQLAFDVTYLRQDFSVKLPVANAQPWPEMQRFDFLVRTRELSEKDAQSYRELFRTAAAGELSPYQHAAVTALRQLTGRDAEPTAAAWRQVLAEGTKK